MKLPALLIICLAPFLLLSCQNQVKTKRKLLKIEDFVSRFMVEHPKRTQNDIFFERSNEDFKRRVDSAMKFGLLDDMPMLLQGIKKYSQDKYAVHFTGNNLNIPDQDTTIIRNLHFDVMGLIDAKMVDSLEQGYFYLVKGSFVKFLDTEFADYTDNLVYNLSTRVEKETYYPEISLGIILVKIDSLTKSSGSFPTN